MSKKIIHLTKKDDGGTCLICCKNNATIKMQITRIKYDDSIMTFYTCDSCLAQMQREIETCE